MRDKDKKSPVVMWSSDWVQQGEKLVTDDRNQSIRKPNLIAIGRINKNWQGYRDGAN